MRAGSGSHRYWPQRFWRSRDASQPEQDHVIELQTLRLVHRHDGDATGTGARHALLVELGLELGVEDRAAGRERVGGAARRRRDDEAVGEIAPHVRPGHHDVHVEDARHRAHVQHHVVTRALGQQGFGRNQSVFDVELGDFYNMLVEDDWCAIRYNVVVTNKQTGERFEQMTMEFVKFKDNPEPIGARVIEGFALSDLPLA